MEFPHHHGHRRDGDDDDERRGPPPPAYGGYGQPDPYGRHPPAPGYGRAEEGYGAPPPAYGAPAAGGYGNVVHVGHEAGGERPHYGGGGAYGGGGPEYGHETRPHHGGGGAPPVRQQTHRIYCKAGEDRYSLASRDGKVCLVRTDRDDDTQVRITQATIRSA